MGIVPDAAIVKYMAVVAQAVTTAKAAIAAKIVPAAPPQRMKQTGRMAKMNRKGWWYLGRSSK